MGIVVDVRGFGFEYVETYYLHIYKLGGIMDSSRYCVKKNRYN